MSKHHKPRFWRLARIYFRRFRLAVWVLILIFIAGLIYVNQVGLPGFIKTPLLQKLRARGIELQFSRLRVRWLEGIVAEKVVFGSTSDVASPQISARQVRVVLDPAALLRLRLHVDALVLEDGHFILPINDDQHQDQELVLENIHSRLRLLPDDQWALDNFTASLVGAQISLSGNITNASQIKNWQALRSTRTEGGESWQARLLRAKELLDQIKFSAAPKFILIVNGDAKDLTSFGVRLTVSTPGADTPWGTVTNGRFSAVVFPTGTAGATHADLGLTASDARTPWASATGLDAELHLERGTRDALEVSGKLKLSARVANTEWARSEGVQVTAQWVHAVTNPIPLSGRCEIKVTNPVTKWAEAEQALLSGEFVHAAAASDFRSAEGSWGWWTNLHPYHLDWNCDLKGALYREVRSEEMNLTGTWRSPELVISNLFGKVSQGTINAAARLRADSRELGVQVSSSVDPQLLLPLLTTGARKWLSQFSWSTAPNIQGSISLVLPAWTDPEPDWRGDVQPTVVIGGRFDSMGPAGYRGIEFSRAHSSISYSNMTWNLPDLQVNRPEGRLYAAYWVNDRTKDFYWRVNSSIDPSVVRPLLGTKELRAFDLAKFSKPPGVEGEVWGRLHEPDRTAVQALVTATNFSFRGESFGTLGVAVDYTNKVLQCLSPRITRDGRQATADSIIADFGRGLVFLTNAVSNVEAMPIARAIGPHVARAVGPYEFRRPPNVRVSGVVPMRGEEGADLRFELDGEDFHWWKLNLARISGVVHWQGYRVELRDVETDFYQGKATGFGNFYFGAESRTRRAEGMERGADFEFGATVTNALLQFLVSDVFKSTNQLEGRLSGTVSVTAANSSDWRSVQGYGGATLRDGLIWDIPIFGVVSPMLNAISPGLGNSRATAATSTFSITNGVIWTDDMDMRCEGMRLRYEGGVDLEGRVDTTVEAELLRDVWLVGPLVSTVFWPVSKMFEYRVQGTLSDPQADPVYVFPKLMLMPFQPFRTLRNLFPDASTSSKTNAPAPGD